MASSFSLEWVYAIDPSYALESNPETTGAMSRPAVRRNFPPFILWPLDEAPIWLSDLLAFCFYLAIILWLKDIIITH